MKVKAALIGGTELTTLYEFQIGKSGLLLNILIWGLKYNLDVECLDKHKKPGYLYVTLENDMPETLARTYAIISGTDEKLEDQDPTELVTEMREHYGFNDDNIQLYMKYRSNRSINAHDIEEMVEEAVDEGVEIRGIVVDYTRRLESTGKEQEERHRLGTIINDLATLAKNRKIPIISAAQLNRAAMTTLETSLASGNMDVIKDLQSSQIGEAWDMIQNADFAAIIVPVDVDGDDGEKIRYLQIKRVKARNEESKISSFAHPFVIGNNMLLQEDANMKKSLSIVNINDGFEREESSSKMSRPLRDKSFKKRSKGYENSEATENPEFIDTDLSSSPKF